MNQPSHIQQAQAIRPAILGGWMYIPYEALGGPVGIGNEKKLLTHKLKFAETGTPPMCLYQDRPSEQYLGVPRAYGQTRFPWLNYVDQRVKGFAIPPTPKRPNPDHPAVKDPQAQREFMMALRAEARARGSFLAMASTGSGKTVCTLDTAAEMGRTTLVMVHLERLRDQWLDEIKDKLGIPEERIGIVQGETCEFQNKDFVVGMMPSMSRRFDYPPAFYNYFGTVIIDECHRVGAPLLSQCVPLFPAYNRWGCSATPKRKDGADKVGFWHIGPISVTSNADALECNIYVKRYKKRGGYWSKNPLQRAKELSYDKTRNAILVDLIRRNHAVGRQMLVIGKYVDHLEMLMKMSAISGIPSDHMGQFTGMRNQPIYQLDENGEPVKDVLGNPVQIDTKQVKVKKEEYERIKRDSQIIFATYGMFKEGIDVPRLDMGLDVLPQSEATQVIGRIRRPKENKPDPYWVTILDETCRYSCTMYQKRLLEYKATGCHVIDSPKI